MEYVRSALPVIVHLFGPHDAGPLLHLTGRLIGMQFYTDIATGLGAQHDQGPQGSGALLRDVLQAEGDDADLSYANGNAVVLQKQWGLMAGVPDYHPACLNALKGLIEGLMDAHDRRLSLDFSVDSERAPGPLTWTIKARPLGAFRHNLALKQRKSFSRRKHASEFCKLHSLARGCENDGAAGGAKVLARHLWRSLAIGTAAQPCEGRARQMTLARRLPALHRRHSASVLTAALMKRRGQDGNRNIVID